MTEKSEIKLMTAEEFAALSDDGKRHELVKGILVEVSRPKPIHGKLQRRLGARIGDFVDAGGLGEVFTESGFLLSRDPDTLRGPDVSYISKNRLPSSDLSEFIAAAPDLAVEIVSPNDLITELDEKLAEYFSAGCQMVWVVYPQRQHVYIYTSMISVTIVDINGVLDGGNVLPNFRLSMRELFKEMED